MKSRTVISSLVSAILLFLYLAAIVGFDIHVNHHDGEVLVVSLLAHTDCESLHPEDVCHCVEHLHNDCQADDEDCENEINMICLTGDGFDFDCNLTPVSVFLCSIQTPVSNDYFSKVFCNTDPLDTSPRRYLNNLCVLRV